MKYFKLTILAFILSITVHSIGAKADNHMTFLDIKIPKSNSYYESEEVAKTIDNYQYYRNQESKGTTSNVNVKTTSNTYGTSLGIKVEKGKENTWGENPYNVFTGNYKVRICSTSILTGASHWGHWLLDGRLAGQL